MGTGANVEIEDVLASLRRLVVNVTDAPPTRRLVLTATQRVDAPVSPLAQLHRLARDETRPQLLVLTNPVVTADRDTAVSPPAAATATGTSTVSATDAAAPEAASEPSVRAIPPNPPSAVSEDPPVQASASAPAVPDAVIAAPGTDAIQPSASDPVPSALATGEPAPVAPTDATTEPAHVVTGPRTAAPFRETPSTGAVPAADEDWTIGALAMPFFRHRNGQAAQGVVPRPAPGVVPALETLEAATAAVDEATLRRLVADVLREELQGELGERMTRNIRKLVRREVAQALAERLPLPDPRSYD